MGKTDGITLDKLKENLMSQKLIPSQAVLLDGIDEKFKALRRQGFEKINDLLKVLKNKDKLLLLSRDTGIAEKYLSQLKREISAYQIKPIKLEDFALIYKDTKKKLSDMGIKNTVQFIESAETEHDRVGLAEKSEVGIDEILLIAKLCDVSRLRYVNVAFAELLVRSPHDTVDKIKSADYMALYEELRTLNEDNRYYTGHLGQNDMEYLVRDKANADVVMEL